MFFSSDPKKGGGAFLVGAIPLRLGAGFLLLHQHVWSQTPQAYQSLWNGKPWELIDLLITAGMPLPKVLALTAAIIALLVAASWILGFVTRLSAILFLPVTLGALLVCNRTGNSFGAEISLLYFFVAVTIILAGPGWLSLDALFKRRRAGASKLRYNF